MLLVALINSQPFKKVTVGYQSTDIVLMFLSLFYTAAIRIDNTGTQANIYFIAMVLILLASALVPLVYTVFFIGYWLDLKRKWIGFVANRFKTLCML